MKNFSDMVREERPDFKAVNGGFQTLNIVELISLIIGQGNDPKTAIRQSRQLVNICDGSLRSMTKRRTEELEVVQGIDTKKAMALQAALELAKRIEQETAEDCKEFDTADAVWRYFRPALGNADHEEAHVLLMNNNFSLIKAVKLSSGGLTETAMDVRMVLKEAILNNATVITLVHNHPSGNTRPSRDDDRITERIKRAAECMRIYMCDYVIVTDTKYYSYAEEGRL